MIKRVLKRIKWVLIAFGTRHGQFPESSVEVPRDITPKYPLPLFEWGIKAEDVRKRIEELKAEARRDNQ